MAQKFKQKRAPDGEIRSDDEIWNDIRYLDPDRGLNRNDIVAVVVFDTADDVDWRDHLPV